jgi:hypothetical protein
MTQFIMVNEVEIAQGTRLKVAIIARYRQTGANTQVFLPQGKACEAE